MKKVLNGNVMEDIVKALNNFIKNTYFVDGHFIQMKSYTVDTKFKAYKHYKLCLFYAIENKSIPIIEETITVKETLGEDSTRFLNIKFLEAVYDYVASNEFKDLMNGTIVF